jgi:major membrane immunogen (membrane-anchored lipoprotein)
MKKQILSITATMLLATSLLITGCKKEDTTAPTITLIGDAAMSIYVGETFTDPGYKATDKDGKDDESDVTSSVTKTGTVDNTKSGDYVITYSVTDEAGNKSADVKRTVSVKHNAASIQGLYSVSESCQGVSIPAYQSNITQAASTTTINISNFGGYNVTVAGSIGGTNNTAVTLQSQTIAGATFSGTGVIDPDGKKVTISYSVTDGVNTDNCTMTMTR